MNKIITLLYKVTCASSARWFTQIATVFTEILIVFKSRCLLLGGGMFHLPSLYVP